MIFTPNFKRNWTFTTAVFLLILLNIIILLTLDLKLSRLARLVSVAAFFVFYISTGKLKNRWVSIALAFFLGQEIFFQFYENPWGFKGYMILGSLAYTMIIVECLPKFNFRSISPRLISVAILLILANVYTLNVIIDMLSLSFRDNFEIFLFYVYSAFIMVLGFIAVVYNNKYNSTRSMRYTFIAFCFIFSDIASLFAYYFGFEFLYIFSRLFFLIGIGLFVSYGLNSEIAREEIYEYDMINKKS
jgi:hypothetical protein